MNSAPLARGRLGMVWLRRICKESQSAGGELVMRDRLLLLLGGPSARQAINTGPPGHVLKSGDHHDMLLHALFPCHLTQ